MTQTEETFSSRLGPSKNTSSPLRSLSHSAKVLELLEDVRSCPIDRLKFISKGTKYQVYRKPIPDSLITNDIKKSRGEPTKVTQATKEPAAPKKATASSKKKITKRKLVLKDETDDEEDLEHRPLSRKKRIPRTDVIQEPPSALVKQTYESSGKHKGIEMLFGAA
ncbi:hypothetical protein Tco_0864445 [Tanacetum coccineum]